MPVFFLGPLYKYIGTTLVSKPFLSQIFSTKSNQMHMVIFSENVFHEEILLYLPDISFSAFYMLYSVPGH